MESLQAIAIQVGLDTTFYYQFIIMVVLYLFLSMFYLRPFQSLIEKRKTETEGAKKEAEKLTRSAEEKFTEYKTKLKSVHQDSKELMTKMEREAKDEESRIVSQASTQARQNMQTAQASLDKQKESLLKEISSDIKSIAELIADKVLGRKSAHSSGGSNGNGRH